jgi:hypothetical protein
MRKICSYVSKLSIENGNKLTGYDGNRTELNQWFVWSMESENMPDVMTEREKH